MRIEPVAFALLIGSLLVADIGSAGRGSANRIATVSIGKHFDKSAIAEITVVVDPVLAPLGFVRMSEEEQKGTFGNTENPAVYYKAEGQAFAYVMAYWRNLDCIAISVTDFTRPAEERIVPAINAIASAMLQRYGSAMKFYSDGNCLHVIPPRS
jgi:hypothetical protein